MTSSNAFLSFWRVFTIMAILLLGMNSVGHADNNKPHRPSSKDRCPVCGMFVAKYPDFLAEIVFTDDSYAFFDGAKDMFKYYLNLKKYNSSKKLEDIKAIYVTDYYSLELIDGLKAYYVVGSDIFGPMGKELIPFQKDAEADEFMRDHSGQSKLRLEDVTKELIKSLN